MIHKFGAIFGWVVAAVIIAAIIGGLFMIGGPIKAREQKIDAKRLSNMQMTARVISCYADTNSGAPETINVAKNGLESGALRTGKTSRCRNLDWKKDPESKAEFEYKRISGFNFELCGVFLREGDSKTGQSYRFNNVNQANILDVTAPRKQAGRHCYATYNGFNK